MNTIINYLSKSGRDKLPLNKEIPHFVVSKLRLTFNFGTCIKEVAVYKFIFTFLLINLLGSLLTKKQLEHYFQGLYT